MSLHSNTINRPNRPDSQQFQQTGGDDATENMSANISVNTLAGFLIDSNADAFSHSLGATPRTESQLRQHAQSSGSPCKPAPPPPMNDTGAAVIEALNQLIYQAGSIYHRGKTMSTDEEHELRESARTFGLSVALIDALVDQTGDANSIVRYCMASEDPFAQKIKKDGNLTRLIQEGQERGESSFDLAGSIWRIFMLKIVQQFLRDHGMDLRHVMEHSSLTARLYEQAVRSRKSEHHNAPRPQNQLDVQADAMRIRDFTQERKKVFIQPSEAREARKAAGALLQFSPKPMFHDIMSDNNNNPLFMAPAWRKNSSSSLSNSRRQTMESDSRDDELSTRAPILQTGAIEQLELRTVAPTSNTPASDGSNRQGFLSATAKTTQTQQPKEANSSFRGRRSDVSRRQSVASIPEEKSESGSTLDQPISAVKRALAIFEKGKVTQGNEGPSNRAAVPSRRVLPGRHSMGPAPRNSGLSTANENTKAVPRRNSTPTPSTRHTSPGPSEKNWTANRQETITTLKQPESSLASRHLLSSSDRHGNKSAPPNRRWDNSTPQIAPFSSTRPGAMSAPPTRPSSKLTPETGHRFSTRQGSISAPPNRTLEDSIPNRVQDTLGRPEPRSLFSAAQGSKHQTRVGPNENVSSRKMEDRAKFEEGISSNSRTSLPTQAVAGKKKESSLPKKTQALSEKLFEEKLNRSELGKIHLAHERPEAQTKVNSGRRIGFTSLVGLPVVTSDPKTSSTQEFENTTPRKTPSRGGNVMSAVNFFENSTENVQVVGAVVEGPETTGEGSTPSATPDNPVPATPLATRIAMTQELPSWNRRPEPSSTFKSDSHALVEKLLTSLHEDDQGIDHAQSPQNKSVRPLHEIPDVVTLNPYHEDGLDAIFSSLTQSSGSEEDMVVGQESEGRGRHKNTPTNRRMRKVPRSGEPRQLSTNGLKETGDGPPSDEVTGESNGGMARPTSRKEDRVPQAYSGLVEELGNSNGDARKTDKNRKGGFVQPRDKSTFGLAQKKDKKSIFVQGVRSPPSDQPAYTLSRGKLSTTSQTATDRKKPSQEEEGNNFFDAFFSPPTEEQAKSAHDGTKKFSELDIVFEDSRVDWVAFESDKVGEYTSSTESNGANNRLSLFTGKSGSASDNRGEDSLWFPSDEGSSELSARAKSKSKIGKLSRGPRVGPPRDRKASRQMPKPGTSRINANTSPATSNVSDFDGWVDFSSGAQGEKGGCDYQPANVWNNIVDKAIDSGKETSRSVTSPARLGGSIANAGKIGRKSHSKFEMKGQSRVQGAASDAGNGSIPGGTAKPVSNSPTQRAIKYSRQHEPRPRTNEGSNGKPDFNTGGEWTRPSAAWNDDTPEDTMQSSRAQFQGVAGARTALTNERAKREKNSLKNKLSTEVGLVETDHPPLTTMQRSRAHFEGLADSSQSARATPANSGAKHERASTSSKRPTLLGPADETHQNTVRRSRAQFEGLAGDNHSGRALLGDNRDEKYHQHYNNSPAQGQGRLKPIMNSSPATRNQAGGSELCPWMQESDEADTTGSNRLISEESASWAMGSNSGKSKVHMISGGGLVDSGDYDKVVQTRTTETLTDSQPDLSGSLSATLDVERRSVENISSFGELDNGFQGKNRDPSVNPTDLSTSTGESVDRYKVDEVHRGQLQRSSNWGLVEVRSVSVSMNGQVPVDYSLKKRTRPGESGVLHHMTATKGMVHTRASHFIKRQRTDENSQTSQESDFDALNPLQNDETGSTGSLSSGESDFNAMNCYDSQDLQPRDPVQDQTYDRSQQEIQNAIRDETHLQNGHQGPRPPYTPSGTKGRKIQIVQGQPVEQHSYSKQVTIARLRTNLGPAQTEGKITNADQGVMVNAYRQLSRKAEMSFTDTNVGDMNIYPWGSEFRNQAGACLRAAAAAPLIETSYKPMSGTTPDQRDAEWIAFEQAKAEWQRRLPNDERKNPKAGFDPMMPQRDDEWHNTSGQDGIMASDGYDPITQQRSDNSNGRLHVDHAGNGFGTQFRGTDWAPGTNSAPEVSAVRELQTLHKFLDVLQAEGNPIPAALRKALQPHRAGRTVFNEKSAATNYEKSASAFYDQYEDGNESMNSNVDRDSDDPDAILADRCSDDDTKTPPSPSESIVDEAELRAVAEISGIPSHVVDLVLGYSKNVRPTTAPPIEGAQGTALKTNQQPGNVVNSSDVVHQDDGGITARCGYDNPPPLTAFQRWTGQQPNGRDPSPRRGRSPTPRSPSQSVASDRVPEGATEEEIKLLNRFIEASACFFDGKKLSTDSETRVRSAAAKVGISELFVDQLIEQAESKNMEMKQHQEEPKPHDPYHQHHRSGDVASGFYTVDVSKLRDTKTEVDDPGCSFWGGFARNIAFLKHQARCFDETSSINSSPSRSWEDETHTNRLPPPPPPPPAPPPPPTRIDARRGYV